MKTAIVLAAGAGTRVWPYGVLRPKTLIPVAGAPIAAHLVEALRANGITEILVAAGSSGARIANYFRNDPAIRVHLLPQSPGTAGTLAAALQLTQAHEFLVLPGDVIVDPADIGALIRLYAERGCACLVDRLGEGESRDWICCTVSGGSVTSISGHPREGGTHRLCAFALERGIERYLSCNSGLFTRVEVGIMPPADAHLEMSLADYHEDGGSLACCECKGAFFDIDKPWHILEANHHLVGVRCAALAANEIGEGATIDPSAAIEGKVRLGRGSRIGRNVTVRGSLLVGEGSTVENGATFEGNAVVGDRSFVGNYCYVADGSSIGSRCVVSHCAELDGLIMDGVYLYHYMELYGILGEGTDIGAATVCGSLRFDDGPTLQRVKGRREIPRSYSQAVFLGDYVRTGVNAILMPGCKVGPYSVVGPGVLLSGDLEERTILMQEQKLTRRSWGPERYGW